MLTRRPTSMKLAGPLDGAGEIHRPQTILTVCLRARAIKLVSGAPAVPVGGVVRLCFALVALKHANCVAQLEIARNQHHGGRRAGRTP